MTQQNQRLFIILLAPLTLLLIPLIAMQFSPEVNWDALDFAVASALLLTASASVILVKRMKLSKPSRVMLLIVALVLLILLWIEMAVGIFGTAIAGS